MSSRPRQVAILAYDGLAVFEYAIAIELFALPRRDLGVPWYRHEIVDVEPRRAVRALGGISIRGSDVTALRRADLIVVPGWRLTGAPAPPPLVRELRRAIGRGAQVFTICSGAFLLAEIGALAGRRATTHWMYADRLARDYPAIEVVRESLFVDCGQLLTSAGSAAGLDAGLHLIRRDYGAEIANLVARRLVVAPVRDGGQAQFIDAPLPAANEPAIADILAWATARLHRPLAVGELAARAHVSERTFLRRFVAATGTTPKRWLQRQRLHRARQLLETTRRSIDEVASACGYRDTVAFRVAFRDHVGTPPGRYRARFRG